MTWGKWVAWGISAFALLICVGLSFTYWICSNCLKKGKAKDPFVKTANLGMSQLGVSTINRGNASPDSKSRSRFSLEDESKDVTQNPVNDGNMNGNPASTAITDKGAKEDVDIVDQELAERENGEKQAYEQDDAIE